MARGLPGLLALLLLLAGPAPGTTAALRSSASAPTLSRETPQQHAAASQVGKKPHHGLLAHSQRLRRHARVQGRQHHGKAVVQGQHHHGKAAVEGQHHHSKAVARGQHHHNKTMAQGQHHHAVHAKAVAQGQHHHAKDVAHGHHHHQGPNTIKAWISSYARTGSSTMMGLVQTAMHVEEIFSIFEPCHSGDRYRGAPLDPKDLTQSFDMFKEIRRCDFNRVNDLWGWNHPLSLHTGFADYSQHGASEACKAAELRVFKTTQFADLKKYVIPGLENDHNLRVIHIQRDPRGILASRLKARGFKNTTEEYMENVCNVMVANKAVRHKNMLKVRFEKWMNAPEEESRKVFKFLNYEFGDVTKDWILEHFDAPSCPDEEKDEFGLCRTDSAIVTAKWKKELSPEWLTFFETGPCKLALHWYGYPHVKPPYTEAPAEEGEEEPAAE